jgi:hypothetical protein
MVSTLEAQLAQLIPVTGKEAGWVEEGVAASEAMIEFYLIKHYVIG